ncbi:unnamed protein product [Miscanthus lutarioriparius]|uniref:Uncharacterized protein n=1 Tax=Miscanthus lutarioriparius TaxID=422564 RepID=A0A811RAJ1_9POAL|nr:unnamed protein product [Miscanthus lutarioriparius]
MPVVTLPNGSTVHLVHRVWDLHEAGRVLEAADPRLDGEYSVQEMERVLGVELWCAHPDRNQRPDIRHALNVVLRFDAPLPILPAKLPAAAAHLQPVANALFDSATSSCGAPVISAAGSNDRGIELV